MSDDGSAVVNVYTRNADRNTQVQLQKDRLEKVPKPARTELRPKNLQQCQPNRQTNRLVHSRNGKTYTNRPTRIRTDV